MGEFFGCAIDTALENATPKLKPPVPIVLPEAHFGQNLSQLFVLKGFITRHSFNRVPSASWAKANRPLAAMTKGAIILVNDSKE